MKRLAMVSVAALVLVLSVPVVALAAPADMWVANVQESMATVDFESTVLEPPFDVHFDITACDRRCTWGSEGDERYTHVQALIRLFVLNRDWMHIGTSVYCSPDQFTISGKSLQQAKTAVLPANFWKANSDLVEEGTIQVTWKGVGDVSMISEANTRERDPKRGPWSELTIMRELMQQRQATAVVVVDCPALSFHREWEIDQDVAPSGIYLTSVTCHRLEGARE